MAEEKIIVSQADREAAADCFAILNNVWDGYSACVAIREGCEDDSELVQRVARHRISGQQILDELVEALEPFAHMALSIREDLPDSFQVGIKDPGVYRLTLGHMRCASNALAKARGLSSTNMGDI